jgi:excisionase family DNA binding protein
MTLPEVAAYLKVSAATVYRLVRRKQLPGFRIGSDWRFSVERVDEWLKGKENAAKVKSN